MASVLGEVDLATIAGNLKDVFGPEVLEQVPEGNQLQEEFKFSQAKQIGEHYSVPVRLTNSHGVTYATGDAGAFALNSPIATVFKEARVTASEMVFREYLSYKAASEARGGKTSFFNAASMYITYGLKSARYRLEATMMRGGSSLFEIASQTGSSTTRTWTISDATFAPGIVAGIQGAAIDVYDDADASNKANTNADVLVTGFDLAAKTISVSGNATDLSDIDTDLGSANVHIFFKSAGGNEPVGLSKLCGATGTTFNIDGSAYSLWTGNTHTVSSSSQLTLNELQKALILPGNKGAIGKSFKCKLSHNTFKDLNSDAAALRVIDDSYKDKLEQGHDGLVYHGSVGKLEVKVHPMCQEGEALVYVPEYFCRIGSTDLAFGVPGSTDKFLTELPDNAGYQYRIYSDQALFTEELRCNVKVTGFTNG